MPIRANETAKGPQATSLRILVGLAIALAVAGLASARLPLARAGPAGTGELSVGGGLGAYGPEAPGHSQRTVTLTYGGSAVPPQVREYLQFPPFEQDHLDNSLQHLSDLVA